MSGKRSLSVHWTAYDCADHVSGPGTWLSLLLPELKARGIQSRVELLVWDREGPLFAALSDAAIQVNVTTIGGTTQDRIKTVISSVEQSASDVFVANHVVPALFAARWIQECGVPSLAVLHSDDPFYRAVIDVFLAGRKCDRIQNVVAVSQCLQQLAQHAAAGQCSIHHLPYGVQIPSTRRHRRDDAGLRIAYAGRLVQEQKRILDVAQVMQRCVSEVPGCCGVLIGDGAEMSAVADLLRNQINTGAIELTGRLLPSAVQTKLSTADVLLLLSDYEGLPIALLEAMACGVVPIVNRMRSGIPELVQHMVNGIVVNDRSDSVLNAVRMLNADPELLQRLSDSARNTVIERFSHNRCADGWETLLRQLNGQRNCKRLPLPVPQRFDLPPVHPALAAEDPRGRELTAMQKMVGTGRRLLKSLAGRVSGIPVND